MKKMKMFRKLLIGTFAGMIMLGGCGGYSASDSYSGNGAYYESPQVAMDTAYAGDYDYGYYDDYAAAEGYHILLSHHPEYILYVPSSVELMLSGHAHGGQWRVFNPFKREWVGVFSPGQGLWPKYTKGVYDGRLVISAGLSNTASVPRFFNPTQLVYIEDKSV